MEVREPSARYLARQDSACSPGYKQTEVGVIPEDWEVSSLGQLGSWKGGATPSMQNPSFWENGTIPWVSSGDVKRPLLFDAPMKITSHAVKNSSTTLLPANSIVIVTRSGILRKYLPVAKNVLPLAINQDIKALIPAANHVPDYLLHLLLWSGPQILARCMKSGTTVESVEFRWLKSFAVPLPPTKAEQEAIAEALSDADALIESLERLLAKKRHLKQGAMQQLLTGKKRLPGFSGEWEVKRLGDMLTICHGKSQRGVESTDGPYPILATGGRIGWSSRFLHDKPSVLIGRKGTINQPQYMETPFWTVDTLFYSVIHEPNHAKFLFYRFCLIDWKQHNEASGVPSLNARTIEAIQVSSPGSEEQTAIATVLSDMDAELAALEEKLAKARALKQGMMQELLTGRIRLV
jgi:type I restriction enzyme S subunit